MDGLANKGSAAKGENFQWSDDLKKWYEKHQKEFEEFVKSLVEMFRDVMRKSNLTIIHETMPPAL